jgi:hypothetical protein
MSRLESSSKTVEAKYAFKTETPPLFAQLPLVSRGLFAQSAPEALSAIGAPAQPLVLMEPLQVDGWERMQYKAFRTWVNYKLSTRQLRPVNLLEDAFEDGWNLKELLEILTGKPLVKSGPGAGLTRDPRFRVQKINNNMLSFAFMKVRCSERSDAFSRPFIGPALLRLRSLAFRLRAFDSRMSRPRTLSTRIAS